MNENDMKQMEATMTRVVGVFAEDVQHKLDILVEGHRMLSDKIDRVESNLSEAINKVDQRLTAVSVDLAAHRCDTEAHLKGWGVREDGEEI